MQVCSLTFSNLVSSIVRDKLVGEDHVFIYLFIVTVLNRFDYIHSLEYTSACSH